MTDEGRKATAGRQEAEGPEMTTKGRKATAGPAKLDPALLEPIRLSIVALLAGTEWAEFAFVRDSVEVSDSTLSKRISALAADGYVEVRKGYVGNRPRTWLNLSPTGRAALRGHIAALQDIAARAGRANQPARDGI